MKYLLRRPQGLSNIQYGEPQVCCKSRIYGRLEQIHKRHGYRKQRRLEGASSEIINYADKAGARELACFAWGMMHMPQSGNV
jgi:hypothetical protein